MAYEPSKALLVFSSTTARAVSILQASKELVEVVAPNPRPSNWGYNSSDALFSDMGRAAIVISVAAFDDFHTRRFAQAVIPCLKKKGPTDLLVKVLSDSGITLKEALNLLTMERPNRRIRTYIDKYLADYTTQRFAAIDELFGALGIKGFSAHVEKKAGRKIMRRSIEKLVLRRHEIVHGGDINQGGKLQKLDPDDAMMRIKLINEFVQHADEIVHKCVS